MPSPFGSLSYTDEITGQPTTLPLHGGEVFASNQRTNYATDWSNIQPRVGFAYQFAERRSCVAAMAFTTDSRGRV